MTGIKGINSSDECNITKLTKKYDPYSEHIQKAQKQDIKGTRAVPMEG